MDPLISVIVPVYKVEEYLDRCIESIVGQTYTNLEIILIDDGSPDRCPQMCDEWAKKDSRIKVIHKQNGGLSDARNAGMAEAEGEFISFVDSDDWLASGMIEKLYQALVRDDSDISACTVLMVWEDDTTNRLLTVKTNCVLDRLEAQRALLEESLLKQPVWYKLYRRDTVYKIPFEVGKQHEDVFWSYQAIGNARRVSIIDYIGYYYRQRPNSIMGKGYTLKRLDAMEAIEKRYLYLAENFPELERDARLSIIRACIFHGQMALRFLPKQQTALAMEKLSSMIKRYPFSQADIANEKLSHRIWFRLAASSLETVCRIKNWLDVGF